MANSAPPSCKATCIYYYYYYYYYYCYCYYYHHHHHYYCFLGAHLTIRR